MKGDLKLNKSNIYPKPKSYLVCQFELTGGEVPRRIECDVLGVIRDETMEIVLAAVSDHLLLVVVHGADDGHIEVAQHHTNGRTQTDGRRPPHLGRWRALGRNVL